MSGEETPSQLYDRLQKEGKLALADACYAEAVEAVGSGELAEIMADRMIMAARAVLKQYGTAYTKTR